MVFSTTLGPLHSVIMSPDAKSRIGTMYLIVDLFAELTQLLTIDLKLECRVALQVPGLLNLTYC